MDSFSERETLFVEVLLPLNLKRSYTYRVPFDRNAEMVPGKRVIVPLGRNKTYAGIILDVHERPPVAYEAKYLLEVIDDMPLVSEQQLAFWRWMATYYLCSLGLVMAAALPAGLKMEGESVVLPHPLFDWQGQEWAAKETTVMDILLANREMSLSALQQSVPFKGLHGILRSLYGKGAILIKDGPMPSFRPKTESMVQLAPEQQDETSLHRLFDQLEKRAPKQLEALMALLSLGPAEQAHKVSDLVQKGAGRQAIQALVTKGILIQESVEVSRLLQGSASEQELELSQEQLRALEQIDTFFGERRPVLLHGITGSGKTSVYIELIRRMLADHKQVLYLLPEIALTSQLVDRLAVYFGDKLLVSHSKFSMNERVELYHRIQSGDPLLILGTRSALFQPFEKLGLIIVDEEHESSFKQHEPAPRFHARDSAIYLAHQRNIPILLGSATPSFESYQNTRLGRYGLVELLERYDRAVLPEIQVVDMLQQKKEHRSSGIFSDTLIQALQQTREAGKQSILFQNRKGYVPVLECTQCHWTPHCINCDISLTYYKYQNNLRCHYCGYTQATVHQCAACGHNGLELIGYGTERIEDELKLLAPELKVERLDYNSTRTKTAHTKLIERFSRGEFDVLIGTQMVAKGLDFDKVETVGIVQADHLLNFPDFRAHERAFSLMTQVAGRAGRRETRGMVYIQSAKADHHVLRYVVDNDYTRLFEEEMQEREQFDYPPVNRLIRITLKHKDALELHKQAQLARKQLDPSFGQRLLGPEKPHVSKIRNWYLMQFILKLGRESKALAQDKRQLFLLVDHMEQQPHFKGLRITLDVDPV